MDKSRKVIAVVTVLVSLLASAEESKRGITARHVGLYQVDLVCPAAPLIGCGSAAKPLLLDLEHSTNVSEAWLNRAGTVIAIVWKEDDAEKRSSTLASVFQDKKVLEVKCKDRKKLLSEFLVGNGWFRGADVDRLSEEEAGIIAGRLVQRIGKQIQLTSEKSKALEAGLTAVMKRKLVTGQPEDRDQLEQDIVNVCQQELSESDMAILKKAREEGAFDHLREQ